MMRVVGSVLASPDRRRSPACRPFNLVPLAVAFGAAALGVTAPAWTTAGAQQPAAQQPVGVVDGVVVIAGSQRPLPDVQVSVVGTNRGAASDAGGRFRIAGVAGETVTLEARRVGYAPARVTARVGAAGVQIVMSERPVQLDEVVVTGTVNATSRRQIGNSISTINAADLVKTEPVQNVQGLLNGRAPGVTLLANSGNVGSGATVRIRGGGSMALQNAPLVYVDGVRVNNQQGTGPSNQAFEASTTTRWNDFSPDDIQSIEVVKGPAATALYGTQAVNGVIQIITKRGSQGKPRWDATIRQGMNQFANAEERLPANYDRINGQIVAFNIAKERKSWGDPIWHDGPIENYNLAVSGGSPAVRYRLSGNSDLQHGVEPSNKQRSYGARGSVQISPLSNLDITANTGFQKGTTSLACEAGCGGALFSAYYGRATRINTPAQGFGSGLPEAYWENYHYTQDFTRFTGNVEATHRFASWGSQRLVIGTDIADETNQTLAGVHPELSFFFGNEADSGSVDVDTRANTLTTVLYNISGNWAPTSTLTAKTTIGTDAYLSNSRRNEAFGSNFPAPGLSAVSSTTAKQATVGYTRVTNAVGLFGQEELGWRDRLFATVGVRTDQNSQFGKKFKHIVYPHYQLAWVASEEPFFRVPGVSQLKLRAAYGESGQAPPEFSTVPIYNATPFGIETGSIGNPNLKPERGAESELGFDASFLGDRAGVEFTYYDGTTKDAIVQRQVAPSTGYPGTQYINAGKFSRKGVEVALRGTPFQRGGQALDFQFSVATNETKVENLGGDQFQQVGTAVRNQVGRPAFAWYARKVVGATVDQATGKISNVVCDDGKGGTMACAGAPDVYVGRTLPNVEGALNAGFRFLRDFRVAGQLDFKRGYMKLNGNDRVRCFLRGICRANFYPQEYDPALVGAYSLGTGFVTDKMIQDASYTKLRELSLTYSVPQSLTSRLGASAVSLTVAGRNLMTWTPYGGLEPEASFQSANASRGGGQWEQATLPQLRSFVTTVNLSF